MTINLSVLFSHFSEQLKLYDLAQEILDRMESATTDGLAEAMNEVLVWTEDRWDLMKAYQSPEEANYGEAWNCFYEDLSDAINDGALEEDEEEI